MELTSERIFRPLQLSHSNSPKSSTSNTKFSWILQHFKKPISEFMYRSIINKPITPICETQRGLRILIKQRRVISGTIHQRYLVFFRDIWGLLCQKKEKGSHRERELSRSFHHPKLFLFEFRGWERIRRGRVQGKMSTCSCLTGLNELKVRLETVDLEE